MNRLSRHLAGTVPLMASALLFLLPACRGHHGPVTTTLGKPRALTSSGYHFDGIKLGMNYGEKVMSRAPYNRPCDNDPIDKRRRRFMVYGALPCRRRVFPGKTTVMFYLAYSRRVKYHQPIEAFAYLYGSYFNDKTNFPLKPGESLDRARQVLGAPLGAFKLRGRRHRLTGHRFKGDIHVLSKQSKIIGFVFGPMPGDTSSEQWRGLLQMYRRYTPHD